MDLLSIVAMCVLAMPPAFLLKEAVENKDLSGIILYGLSFLACVTYVVLYI